MTDNEIIKALECCITNKCDECAICKECHDENGKGRVQVVLDLINRQKAEIEVAKNARTLIFNVNQGEMATVVFNHVKETESEAIKEFAERLKEEYSDFDELHEEIRHDNLIYAIDNLVKEMTEKNDD